MRQICVLQWEEIKTKNSGAKHQLCGIIRYIAIVDMNNDYKTQEYLVIASICFKVLIPWESLQKGTVDIIQCLTGLPS